jgi:hypothetical protein
MTLSLPRLLTSRQAPSELACDDYLTDGHTLFRVVSRFTTVGDNVFASLEDCLTLEVHAYAPGELVEMRLIPVRTDQ